MHEQKRFVNRLANACLTVISCQNAMIFPPWQMKHIFSVSAHLLISKCDRMQINRILARKCKVRSWPRWHGKRTEFNGKNLIRTLTSLLLTQLSFDSQIVQQTVWTVTCFSSIWMANMKSSLITRHSFCSRYVDKSIKLKTLSCINCT